MHLQHPQQPAQALLDPHIRWPMLVFRLPFALVFTGVGVAAGSRVVSGTVAVAAAGDSSVGAVRSGLAVGAAGVPPQAESSRAARTGRIIQRKGDFLAVMGASI